MLHATHASRRNTRENLPTAQHAAVAGLKTLNIVNRAACIVLAARPHAARGNDDNSLQLFDDILDG